MAEAELQQKVAGIVSRVILETSGRVVAPGPEEPLFEKHLDAVDLGRLLLALQESFEFVIDPAEAKPRVMGSIAAITKLVAARTGS